MSNPFLDQNNHAPQPAATQTSTEEAPREEAHGQQAVDYVAEMRAAGHPRQAIVAELMKSNVGQATGEALINQADLFAGMMGRPHPMDIDPQVRAQIDQDGPMMVTESLAKQNDRGANPEAQRSKAIEKAREMAANGADSDTLMLFLTDAGAPEDQARELISKLVEQSDEGKNKKKRGLFRR